MALSSITQLLTLQNQEALKPRLSKISWLPDVIRVRGSIIPVIIGPVLSITIFAAGVAGASQVYGKHLHLTNSVVPLLSIVVGLLLVFRNGSAYERYSEGRKDFTTLISNARNLTRNIWINVNLPSPYPPSTTQPPSTSTSDAPQTRAQLSPKSRPKTRSDLKQAKIELIKLVVAYVFATKHHLRAEGGVHHEDLRGLIPDRLFAYNLPGMTGTSTLSPSTMIASPEQDLPGNSYFPNAGYDIESNTNPPTTSPSKSATSHGSPRQKLGLSRRKGAMTTTQKLKRRPTAVRVHTESNANGQACVPGLSSPPMGPRDTPSKRASILRTAGVGSSGLSERTPLIVTGGIKAGIVPEDRRESGIKREQEEIRVVELGLPLIIAHEISRTLYRFRCLGYLDTIGPAGYNALQTLVQSMTDQLGAMERVVQTPLPYVFAVHIKQCVSLFLYVLPFTLVEVMAWRMVPLVTVVAFTLMGIEGIASEIEQPFGDDVNDLNLDLYCTELRCEVEYILERLPEGDDDADVDLFRRGHGEHIGLRGDDGGDGDDDGE